MPATRRDDRDRGTGSRLAPPMPASADYAVCGSPVDGGSVPARHESGMRNLVSKPLAATGSRKGRVGGGIAAPRLPGRGKLDRHPCVTARTASRKSRIRAGQAEKNVIKSVV